MRRSFQLPGPIWGLSWRACSRMQRVQGLLHRICGSRSWTGRGTSWATPGRGNWGFTLGTGSCPLCRFPAEGVDLASRGPRGQKARRVPLGSRARLVLKAFRGRRETPGSRVPRENPAQPGLLGPRGRRASLPPYPSTTFRADIGSRLLTQADRILLM